MMSLLVVLLKVVVAVFLAVKLVVVALAGVFVGAAARFFGRTRSSDSSERHSEPTAHRRAS